jgi:hypothetical protein
MSSDLFFEKWYHMSPFVWPKKTLIYLSFFLSFLSTFAPLILPHTGLLLVSDPPVAVSDPPPAVIPFVQLKLLQVDQHMCFGISYVCTHRMDIHLREQLKDKSVENDTPK